MSNEMTLSQTRDQIHAFATAKQRDSDQANYYVEMNVLTMDSWWKAIDAHLASREAKGDELSVACQIRFPLSSDPAWKTITQKQYESTLFTGHAYGISQMTKDFELRPLFAHPAAQEAAQPKGEVVQPVEAVDVARSLKWCAGVVQWATLERHIREGDFITIDGEKRTVSDILDEADYALAHPRPTGDGYDVARHNEWLEANAAPTGEQAAEVWESAHGYQEAFYKIAEILEIGAMPESPSKVFASVMLPMIRELVAAQPLPAGVPDEYLNVARLIGCIFYYGGFKAETFNERELEKLLRATGNWYESEAELLAAAPAPGKGDEA